jgi:hypothetical protein
MSKREFPQTKYQASGRGETQIKWIAQSRSSTQAIGTFETLLNHSYPSPFPVGNKNGGLVLAARVSTTSVFVNGMVSLFESAMCAVHWSCKGVFF